ncbi:hypothetical protein PVAP13_1KG241830 [Panicum virgatum]|uniref:Uncharacterized protein n=1 Tax=Panicum virgatum TaxID=38727 RepID=A0A8T0XAT5_PANVG|nr:hypothetical protein PVAP13_1KG241830 [Panicum virgatum]
MQKCIELDPTFLKGYVRKAKVQFLMEDYENMATYQEGLRCDPNNPEILDGLRRCEAALRWVMGVLILSTSKRCLEVFTQKTIFMESKRPWLQCSQRKFLKSHCGVQNLNYWRILYRR